MGKGLETKHANKSRRRSKELVRYEPYKSKNTQKHDVAVAKAMKKVKVENNAS